eukprot:TRINITY_DN19828_c0_g1_i1.p1 TRINITY_DN19828_c0_g1~~TRINITY_DN19828_c0_g1_i1.p1  ORF type:complete len:356 (-),score=67.09 TRINITY_DN19828_c0_g1_i1:51-1094(-)
MEGVNQPLGDRRRPFLVSLFLSFCFCVVLFSLSNLTNQSIEEPCIISQDGNSNEFMGLSVDHLKTILVNLEVPSMVKFLVEGIFDNDMEGVNQPLGDRRRPFLVSLFLSFCFCVVLFSLSNLTNQSIEEPCIISQDGNSNEFMGLSVDHLKTILVNLEVPSMVKFLVEGIFDNDMEKIIVFEKTKNSNKEIDDVVLRKWDGPEPQIINYYKDRLRICEKQNTCSESTKAQIMKDLDHIKNNHPKSPYNKNRLLVSDDTCLTKKDEFVSLQGQISSFRPSSGCSLEEAMMWDSFNKVLTALIDKMEELAKIAHQDEVEANLHYKKGLAFDPSLQISTLSSSQDKEMIA